MRFRERLSRHAVPLIAAALPSIAWLAPMLRDPAHTIIGGEGDNLFFVRQIWWLKRAVVDLHRSPLFDPFSYWPAGYATTRGDLTPANTVASLPITLLAGPIAAYNVMLVAGFLLTAWACYAWVYRLGGSRGGGLVAAVIASMAPYRLAHAYGHLNVASTYPFPMALWAFEELLRARRDDLPAARAVIALGASLALTAFASWYYAYSMALIFPIYAALRVLSGSPRVRARIVARDVIAAVGIAAIVVTPFAIPYLRASASGGLRHPFTETTEYALNVYDFVIPNAINPWWNGWMARVFPRETHQWVERGVSLGYIAMGLALAAIVRRRRLAAPPLALAVVAFVSAVLALGPFVYVGDRVFLVRAPYLVAKTADWLFYRIRPFSPYRGFFWTRHVVAIPLPALALWLWVPITAGMRSLARFGYWTILMTAGLAGLAVGQLTADRERSGRRLAAVALTAGLALAVAAESWSIKSVARFEPRAVDRWIASEPAGDVVLEVPLAESIRPAQDYYVTVQQHPTILGPQGDSFPPAMFHARTGLIARLPNEAALSELRALGLTLLIVHPITTPDWPAWERVLGRAGAAEAARFDDVRVYRLPSAAGASH